jgi:transcription elongation factor GreA-like protein
MNTTNIIQGHMEAIREDIWTFYKDNADYKDYIKTSGIGNSRDNLIDYIDNLDFDEYMNMAYEAGKLRALEELEQDINSQS